MVGRQSEYPHSKGVDVLLFLNILTFLKHLVSSFDDLFSSSLCMSREEWETSLALLQPGAGLKQSFEVWVKHLLPWNKDSHFVGRLETWVGLIFYRHSTVCPTKGLLEMRGTEPGNILDSHPGPPLFWSIAFCLRRSLNNCFSIPLTRKIAWIESTDDCDWAKAEREWLSLEPWHGPSLPSDRTKTRLSRLISCKVTNLKQCSSRLMIGRFAVCFWMW